MDKKGSLPSHKGEKIRSYTVAFKLEAIEYASIHGNRKASINFKIDGKRVREWRKQESALREMDDNTKRKRRDGGGRKVLYDDLDRKLYEWVIARREAGVRVTGRGLKQEALRLHKLDGKQSFKASCGWLRRFMKRYTLSFRRSTHVAQKTEEELSDRMQDFLSFVIEQRKRRGYDLSKIGNMDETPVWVDMPGNYTLENTGTKTVTMSTTGHEKSWITVILGAMADGTKLPPMVLFKGVRLPKEMPSGLIVKMTPNAWADEHVTQHWLRHVWGKDNQNRRLLVWDSFKGHLTPDVKAAVREDYNTDMAVIPGGCTSKLQPCDVSWNKLFKGAYRDRYDHWVISGPVSMTKGGNRRAPDRTQILQWIKESWAEVAPDIIRKSFKKCGISNSIDGEEDHLLFLDSDNEDDPFESAGVSGFTAGTIAGANQLPTDEDAAVEEAAPEAAQEVLVISDSEPEDDMFQECDYECPDSPGH